MTCLAEIVNQSCAECILMHTSRCTTDMTMQYWLVSHWRVWLVVDCLG